MEVVSESFKNAIKSDTREIKGYVEVVYESQDNTEYSLSTAPDRLRNSLATEIADGIKKDKNYASLEEKYTLLDGSFILPNYNVKGDNGGYVSNDVFSDITSPIITISKSSDFVTSSGISIYFENNVAQNFTLKITDSNDKITTVNVADNSDGVYQYIFENQIEIKSITIEILQMEYINRRIRISEIDLGVSQRYEGSDLVSFTVNEEIDLLLTSTPINDCSVNLNNYTNMFNPLNPTGLVKYLTSNAVVKPYIGVLTELNGIEYVSMGYFYLKDWSADVDGNVTLNGQSLMARLANLDLTSSGGFLTANWDPITISKYFTETYGYTFDLSWGSGTGIYLKHNNLLSYLQAHFSFMVSANNEKIFHITRDNRIVYEPINFDYSVDAIPRNELLEDVKYEVKTVLNKVKIKNIDTYNMTSTTKEDVLNQTYTLTSTEEYVWFTYSKYIDSINSTQVFSYTNNGNGTADIIDYNNWMAYVKFNGNIGDEITIHFKDYVFDNPPTFEFVETNNIPNGDTLSLDFTEYFKASNNDLKSTASFYLNTDKKYKVTGKYIGDPSYTPGDTITIETRFGNKDVIMTKHSLTFDGGLSGTFEGIGD